MLDDVRKQELVHLIVGKWQRYRRALAQVGDDVDAGRLDPIDVDPVVENIAPATEVEAQWRCVAQRGVHLLGGSAALFPRASRDRRADQRREIGNRLRREYRDP